MVVALRLALTLPQGQGAAKAGLGYNLQQSLAQNHGRQSQLSARRQHRRPPAPGQKRLPRVAFDYIDGGADGEVTLRENCRVFDDVLFRPRNAVAIARVRSADAVLGAELALPFALAPVGSSRMFYPRGEVVAAGAAGDAGTAYTLSTLSGCRVDEVGAGTKGPLWYQLYLVGGRDVATAGLERAMKARGAALFVTIDTAVAGLRERDFRNGTKELLTRNPWTMLPYVRQFLARPGWLAGFIGDGGLMNFPNVVLPDGPMPYADVGAALETVDGVLGRPALDSRDLEGPIVDQGRDDWR